MVWAGGGGGCDYQLLGVGIMSLEVFAAAMAVVGTIVTTTVLVLGKLTSVEISIARLQVSMSQFEARIKALEKWRDV